MKIKSLFTLLLGCAIIASTSGCASIVYRQNDKEVSEILKQYKNGTATVTDKIKLSSGYNIRFDVDGDLSDYELSVFSGISYKKGVDKSYDAAQATANCSVGTQMPVSKMKKDFRAVQMFTKETTEVMFRQFMIK